MYGQIVLQRTATIISKMDFDYLGKKLKHLGVQIVFSSIAKVHGKGREKQNKNRCVTQIVSVGKIWFLELCSELFDDASVAWVSAQPDQ